MFCGHGVESKDLERVILAADQYVAVKGRCGDTSIINPDELQNFFEADPEIKIPRISTAATAAQIPFYSFGIERNGELSTTDSLKVYRPSRHTNTDAYQMVYTVPNIGLAPLAYVQLAPIRIQDISYLGDEMTGVVFGIWMSGVIPQTARPNYSSQIQEISRDLEYYYEAGHVPNDNTYKYEALVFVPGTTKKAIRTWRPFGSTDPDTLTVHFRRVIEAAFEHSIVPFSEYIRLALENKKKTSIEELTISDLAAALFDMKWLLGRVSDVLGGDEPFLLINPSCRSVEGRDSAELARLRAASASPPLPLQTRKQRRGAKKRGQTKRYRRQK